METGLLWLALGLLQMNNQVTSYIPVDCEFINIRGIPIFGEGRGCSWIVSNNEIKNSPNVYAKDPRNIFFSLSTKIVIHEFK